MATLTFPQRTGRVRFTYESGHLQCITPMYALGHKRTFALYSDVIIFPTVNPAKPPITVKDTSQIISDLTLKMLTTAHYLLPFEGNVGLLRPQ